MTLHHKQWVWAGSAHSGKLAFDNLVYTCTHVTPFTKLATFGSTHVHFKCTSSNHSSKQTYPDHWNTPMCNYVQWHISHWLCTHHANHFLPIKKEALNTASHGQAFQAVPTDTSKKKKKKRQCLHCDHNLENGFTQWIVFLHNRSQHTNVNFHVSI